MVDWGLYWIAVGWIALPFALLTGLIVWKTCRHQVAGWWRGWRLAGAYKRFTRGR